MEKELSLYIHIPFCIKKCAYCDFLSSPATKEVQQAYCNKLIEEIEIQGTQYQGVTVPSVFIGGGTPSVLEPEWIQKIMEAVKLHFSLQKDAEISMEMNPGTVNERKLELYRRAAINRLSIGLQSTQDDELKELGRIHTYEQFLESYRLARKVGFDNINIDLMSALPNQTMESYMETLDRVIELKPEHISSYSLIIEEGTPFFELQDSLKLPDEDLDREMYEMTDRLLKKAGYHRYEISNYALDKRECEHNKKYWTRKNYLGLGLGAASMIEDVRFRNTNRMEEYLQASKFGTEDIQRLTKNECMEEFMFLGLRMMNGVEGSLFQEKFGQKIDAIYGEKIDQLWKEKLLEREANRYYLTDKGIDVSNYVLAQFLF